MKKATRKKLTPRKRINAIRAEKSFYRKFQLAANPYPDNKVAVLLIEQIRSHWHVLWLSKITGADFGPQQRDAEKAMMQLGKTIAEHAFGAKRSPEFFYRIGEAVKVLQTHKPKPDVLRCGVADYVAQNGKTPSMPELLIHLEGFFGKHGDDFNFTERQVYRVAKDMGVAIHGKPGPPRKKK